MKRLLFLFVILPVSADLYCQDTIKINVELVFSSPPLDFYSYSNQLACHLKSGQIVFLNPEDFSVTPVSYDSYAAIAVDRNGKLWAADSGFTTYSWSNGTRHVERNVAASKYKFVFDKDNNLFLATSQGLYDSRTNMFYGDNSLANGLRANVSPGRIYFANPDEIVLLYFNRVIAIFQSFNIETRTYASTKRPGMAYHMVTSISNGPANGYFMIESDQWGIAKIWYSQQRMMNELYTSKYDSVTGPLREDEEYLGGSDYDFKHHDLYFYSKKGLMKAAFDSVSVKLAEPKRVIPSCRSWLNNVPSERDFTRGVTKLLYSSHYIAFLNPHEGLFIYKNGKLY